jgi:hypothetical protein
MTASVHPAAPHHLPGFIAAPGETDVLMVAMGIFLLVAVLLAGNCFLWLHTLPERTAHKSKKLQFEIVAILGLLALFTHVHLFWVAALLLAFIDLPEFGKPLDRMAGSLETIAGTVSSEREGDMPAAAPAPKDEPVAKPSKEATVHSVPTNGVANKPDKPVLAPASARS